MCEISANVTHGLMHECCDRLLVFLFSELVPRVRREKW